MSQFAEPASASGIEWASLNGRLLIIEPHEVVTDINTTFGVTDAVRADVTIIDGDQAGTKYADTLVFPRALKAQLASRVGQKVLGRLGQGTAKPGQNPPWMLTTGTPADQEAAVTFLTRTQLTAADLAPDGTEPF